jgi:hypothetical protein
MLILGLLPQSVALLVRNRPAMILGFIIFIVIVVVLRARPGVGPLIHPDHWLRGHANLKALHIVEKEHKLGILYGA